MELRWECVTKLLLQKRLYKASTKFRDNAFVKDPAQIGRHFTWFWEGIREQNVAKIPIESTSSIPPSISLSPCSETNCRRSWESIHIWGLPSSLGNLRCASCLHIRLCTSFQWRCWPVWCQRQDDIKKTQNECNTSILRVLCIFSLYLVKAEGRSRVS